MENVNILKYFNIYFDLLEFLNVVIVLVYIYIFVKVLLIIRCILGYLTGSEDYYIYYRCYGKMCGMDLRENVVLVNYFGIYFIYFFV